MDWSGESEDLVVGVVFSVDPESPDTDTDVVGSVLLSPTFRSVFVEDDVSLVC